MSTRTHGTWLGRQVRHTLKLFGLSDDGGDLSFNKFCTLVLLATFTVCVVRALTPSPWLLAFGIFVGICGFGLKAVMAYIARMETSVSLSGTGAVNSQLNVEAKADLTEMYKAKLAARDVSAGIDPS